MWQPSCPSSMPSVDFNYMLQCMRATWNSVPNVATVNFNYMHLSKKNFNYMLQCMHATWNSVIFFFGYCPWTLLLYTKITMDHWSRCQLAHITSYRRSQKKKVK
jgi:hypothetical protein